MEKALGWAVFLALGLMLIVLGARGRLGSALGALVTPSAMTDTGDSNG